MLGLLAKAAIYRPPANLTSAYALPGQIIIAQQLISPAHCESYHRLVGWPSAEQHYLHPNYIQVLTLPMQLKMMTKFPFPFKALGLVHIANKINVVKLPTKNSTLTLSTYFGDYFSHKKGVVFELHSEASCNGVLALKATSYYLARIKKPTLHTLNGFKESALLSGANKLEGEANCSPLDIATFSFPENSGRQYARVSGDYNPIHLWPMTSRLFGFSQAIAHGMHSHALCLSSLQLNECSDLRQNCSIRAVFKHAILLPNSAALTFDKKTAEQGNFALNQVQDGQLKGKQHSHILGEVSSLTTPIFG